MTEQIGLRAILETKEFKKGEKIYLDGLRNLDGATNKTAKNVNSGMKSVNQGFLSANKGALTLGAGVAALAGGVFIANELGQAIIGVGAATLSSAADMEQKLANITSLMGGTVEETQQLKDLITDLGLDPGLKVSASEASDSIELLVRNGVELQDIMDGAAKSSIALANATGADFGTAADIATDSMTLFNIEAAEMDKAVNGITSVVTSSKFDINDYRLALAQAGGVASAVGVEFGDFNTSVAAIAPLFASGSDAGTSFKTFLQRLAPTTQTAADSMSELGLFTGLTDKEFKKVENSIAKTEGKIAKLDPTSKNYQKKLNELNGELGILRSQLVSGSNAFFDAQGNMKSMSEISKLLSNASADLSEEQKNVAFSTIFGTDAMRAAFGLASAGEGTMIELADGTMIATTAFDQLQKKMGNTDAAEIINQRMNTLQGTMEIVGGVFETVGIKIGEAILPTARLLANRLLELTERVMPLVEPALVIIENGITSLANSITSFLEPAIDGAINLLSGLLGTDTNIGITTGVTGLDAIQNIVLPELPDLQGGNFGLLDNIKNFFKDLPDIASDAMSTVSGVFSSFTTFLSNTVLPGFNRLFDAVFGGGESAITLSGIWESVLKPAIQSIGWYIENILTPAFNIVIDALSIALPPIIQTISSLFSNILVPAISLVGQAYSFVFGFIEQNMPLLKSIAKTVFNAIGQAINFVSENVIPLLMDKFELLKNNIPVIIQKISDVWDKFFKPAIDRAIGAVSFLFNAFQEKMPVIKSLAESVFERIADVIMFISDNVMPFLITQLNKLSAFWEENGPLIVSTLDIIGKFILDNLVSNFNTAINIIQFLGEIAIATFDTFWQSFKFLWDLVSPIFDNLIDIVLELGQLIMQVINGDWQGAWESAGTIVMLAFKGIVIGITNGVIAILELFDTNLQETITAWEFVWESITLIFEAALQMWKDLWGLVFDVVESLWLFVPTFIIGKWQETWDGIEAFWIIGLQSWSDNWDLVKQIAVGVWGTITTTVSTAIENIKTFFGNTFDEALDVWAGNWDMVLTIVDTTWENIKTSITGAFDFAKDMFDTGWARITTATKTAWLNLVESVRESWGQLLTITSEAIQGWITLIFETDWADIGEGIINLIASGVQGATSIVKNAVDGIVSQMGIAFSSATQYIEIGRSIIAGIIQGISDGADQLFGEVADLAKTLLQVVKDALGIASPSKEAAKLGAFFIDGFILGIERNSPNLDDTLSSLFDIGDKFSGFSFATVLGEQVDSLSGSVDDINKSLEKLNKEEQKLNNKTEQSIEDATRLAQIERSRASLLERRTFFKDILEPKALALGRFEEAKDLQKSLKDQLGFFELLTSSGVEASDILSNLQFGANIDVTKFVSAQADVLQKINEATERNLLNRLRQAQQIADQTGQELSTIQKAFIKAEKFAKRYFGTVEDESGVLKAFSVFGGEAVDVNSNLVTSRLNALDVLQKQRDTLGLQLDIMDEITRNGLDFEKITHGINVGPQLGLVDLLELQTRLQHELVEQDKIRLGLASGQLALAEEEAKIAKKKDDLKKLERIQSILRDIQVSGLNPADIIDGITLGIETSESDLLDLMIAIANNQVQAMEDTLGIASPSKRFAEVGRQSMAGFAIGAKDEERQAINAVRSVSNAVVQAPMQISSGNGNNQLMRMLSQVLSKQSINNDVTINNNQKVGSEMQLAQATVKFANQLQRLVPQG